MAGEALEWPEEGKRGFKWLVVGLIAGIIVVGCFIVLIFPRAQNVSPVASFTYSPSSPSTADTIQFIDASSDEDGRAVSWSWNFGDGTTSTAKNPTHHFINDGTYEVTLTVTDDDGATDNMTLSINIANSPPTANFTCSPNSPTTDNIVQFLDTSSDSNGTIVSWYWNFGDGTTSTAKNPTHHFINDGTYEVTLTVTDDDGATDNMTRSINIANSLPTANFTYSPSSPTTQGPVQFSDQSTDSDGTIVSWSWDFGDGGTSTTQNPTHQYTTGGNYTATLVVTDDDGGTGSHAEGITVTPIEVAFQNFEEGNGTPGAYFYDAWQSNPSSESATVHGGARSVKMNSGDGGGTVGINAASPSGYFDLSNATTFSVWVYDTQGNNTIELKLKDSDGTIGPGQWSTMSSTENLWTKITWDISGYSGAGLDKSQIASIEFYEWNQGTYYFDDVSFIQRV